MPKINFEKEILFIHKEIEQNIEILRKQKILKSDIHNYKTKEKEDFLIYWNNTIKIFTYLLLLLKKSKYKKIFYKINYDYLVINRYIAFLYYHFLVQIIVIFGKHKRFLIKFLEENYKKDYLKYSKIIYKPKYVSIINTPNIFLYGLKPFINKKYYKFINIDHISVKPEERILVDYGHLLSHINKRFEIIFFSVSKIIGLFLSGIRFTKRTKGLITNKNLNKYLSIAKPGDILLTRGNWNATNVPIPGFWKHMSLYIGKGDYLMKYYDKYNKIKLNKDKHYIIESTSEGVLVKDIQKLISHNDYLGVFRTDFSKSKIKKVIKNTLLEQGKGYDYGVNYYSDKHVVCSELVLKSFQKEKKDAEGIEVFLESIGNSLSFPPNNLFKIIVKNNITPFFFIDSIEKTGKNFINSDNEFIKSQYRSRFTFFNK